MARSGHSYHDVLVTFRDGDDRIHVRADYFEINDSGGGIIEPAIEKLVADIQNEKPTWKVVSICDSVRKY